MPYDRFKSEEELLKSVLRYISPFDSYPKVTAIAGNRIYPDIDILKISAISPSQYRMIGYELKLIKFDKRSKGLGRDSFYKGIGEALLYLKNGVHRVILVLGFHENVLSDEMIDGFHKWLLDNRELLNRILGNYLSVETALYEGGALSSEVSANSDFSPPNDETRFLSEALLKRKFTFDKSLVIK